MALSMSVSAGAHNARHNTDLAYRANLRNVDADLSVGNISIRDVPIAEAYETVFGDSLRAYNAKQKSKGHPERCIGDYLSKIEKAYSDDSARVKSGNKGRVNVPKPCYEYVLQIGNRDTFGGELDNGKAEEIFRETADSIRSKTEGAIEWFQIAVHFDEKDGTPHMHMAGIPYATGCKRGRGGCEGTSSRTMSPSLRYFRIGAMRTTRGGQKLLTADAPLLSRSSSPTGTVGRMRTVGNMRRSLTITSGTTS